MSRDIHVIELILIFALLSFCAFVFCYICVSVAAIWRRQFDLFKGQIIEQVTANVVRRAPIVIEHSIPKEWIEDVTKDILREIAKEELARNA